MYKKISIKIDRAKNIISGHPWIFSHAIEKIEEPVSGELYEVYAGETFIGIGYYNDKTDIAIRILTRKKEKIDEKFFVKRFEKLKEQKEKFIKDTNAYRICFGESDNVPGIFVDKYDDVLVLQIHTLGAANLKKFIVDALVDVFSPVAVYEKLSEHSTRIEGFPAQEGVLYGELPKEIIIEENGYKFYVDVVEGQKTGFFLDQRDNRKSILPYVEGRKVLNCFSYSGGFSVYAAAGGAKEVTSVDISKAAIELCKKNFKLNKLKEDEKNFVAEDVFEFLKKTEAGEYDLIILDPPSFARSRSQIKQAIKAYTKINSDALNKLPSGGILVSASCTAHIDELTFIKILHQSSVLAKCTLKVLHTATQPFDHAYNLHFPEGKYLKFFVMMKE